MFVQAQNPKINLAVLVPKMVKICLKIQFQNSEIIPYNWIFTSKFTIFWYIIKCYRLTKCKIMSNFEKAESSVFDNIRANKGLNQNLIDFFHPSS